MKRKSRVKKSYFCRKPSSPIKYNGSCLSWLERRAFPWACGCRIPVSKGSRHHCSDPHLQLLFVLRFSHIFSRCISISSYCTGIAARINFNIEYLVTQHMYILYKYFHLVGAEHCLSKWETQKLLNIWLTASHLALWFTKFPQSFCEDFWLCIIHIVHCFLHKVVLDLPVICGHWKLSQCTKLLLSGQFVTPSRALFFHPVQYCRHCPVQSLTELMEHLISRGLWKSCRKSLNLALIANHEFYKRILCH